MLHIKSQYKDIIRLTKVSYSEVPTFYAIKTHVFNSLRKDIPRDATCEGMKLSYMDTYLDKVTLDGDTEWNHCLEDLKYSRTTLPCVKIIVDSISIPIRNVAPVAPIFEHKPQNISIDREAQTQELVTIYSMTVEGDYNAQQEERKIEQIEDILQSLEEAENKLQELQRERDPTNHTKLKKMLDEWLTQKLLKLDAFEGCTKVRRFRKYVVLQINQLLIEVEKQ